MSEKNKVSIIIPIYNSEDYIEKCLKSILKQTYKNYEIIAINDGSSDNSKKILESFSKKYPNVIRYISQANMGVAKTRNKGIKISTGDYITFIDNDDFIDEDYLEKMINETEDGYYDVVLSGYRRPNEKGEIIKELSLENVEWSKMMILAPWAKIYKKSYLINNDFEFLDNNIGEDVFFNMQALLCSYKIKISAYIGYNWFYNVKSVSNTIQKDITNLEVYKLLDKTYEELKKRELLQKNYDLIEMSFIRYIIWFLSFSTKKVQYRVISENYDRLFEWLENRFPNYKKNKNIGLRKPKGEIKKIQWLYLFFMIFHRLHLGKAVVYIYSKI